MIRSAKGLKKALSLGTAISVLSFTAVGIDAAPLPGGTLDPLSITKYVTPLVIPPVMPNDGTGPNNYDIAIRQFTQQILPTGLPPTTVWSYGSALDPATFNYPAFTIETTANNPVNVRWINDLKDPVTGNFLPHLLPIDQTLHWANPPATGCIHGPVNSTDCTTANPGPYTGPVPLITHVHGAHVDPHSDGYPEAWYLPAATNIPAGYAMKGKLFDDATGSNLGDTGYADFLYRNDQPAATLWYHDHTLGMTRSNVYAGPAGFWLIRGGAFDGATNSATGLPAVLPGPAPVAGNTVAALNTPGDPVRNAVREIPLAIQDRSFNLNGSLFYPASRAFFDGYLGPYAPASDISPTWNPEAFFNTMVLNGKTWPVLEVAPARYRLRLLNGCNSRFLNLALFEVLKDPGNGKKQKNNAKLGREFPFFQIGAEQGFLPKVVMVQTGFATELPGNGTIPALTPAANPQQALLMGLAERADVIVDFTGLPAGTRIRMINTAPDAPFGGFPAPPADPSTTGQVMEFVVNAALLGAPGSTDLTATAPQNLVLNAEPVLGAPEAVRQVSLNEEMSGQVCVTATPAGRIKVIAVSPAPMNDVQIATFCAATNPPSVPMAPKAAKLGTVDLTNPVLPVGTPLAWDDMTGASTPKMVTLQNGVQVMVNVTENPELGSVEEWEIYNFTVDAHPIHLHLVRFEVTGRTPIPGVVPAPVPVGVLPWEKGFKDTVIAYPGEITKVKAQFDIPGLYVWHCHIVEHEDNEMMRPYIVGM
ncbi:multicopper oxidase family protein [Geobacter sp. DSM 9736]|uniref:multicopper oxidase family protein n=1 Tax=Geobacter sp. DSM 9736 TaxID=1277350 RepID=UPI000B50A02B|nr:multicopper oxidase domain-containing protein [Geobacter sp. DSM 9736]SNB47177.1 Multicopper oxidase [Geobacter sp. DSM 9736]